MRALVPVYAVTRALDDDDLEHVERLDRACFPIDDRYPVDGAEWWLVRHGEDVVAFAGAKPLHYEGAAYLCRAGVLASARGHGLQRRLIRARLRWARRENLTRAVTYTVSTNHPSSNNLIAEGFRLYDPATGWAGREGTLYWHRRLW